MSGWNFNSPSSDKSSKAEFTKFPVGVTSIRVVDDEPYVRWTHWMPQFKRSVNCPGKGCPICEIRKQQKANKLDYTYAMGRRLAMNIINRETGKLEIMEQGVGFFEDLRDVMEGLSDDGLTLLDADVKVKRRGTGKDDTSYRVDKGDTTPLSDSDKKLIEGKIDLKEFFKPHAPEQILRLVQGEKWEDVMKSADKSDNADEQVELR